MIAPWPTLMWPVPLSRRATSPGTATESMPAPMPSSTWTGMTPQVVMTPAAMSPRTGRALNAIRMASQ
jgi:hypothetical protein